MKIAIEKATGKIAGFASGDKTDFSYLDSNKYDVKILKGDSLPDRIEALKWDGKKIIVDKKLKQEAESNDIKEQLIQAKLAEVQRQEAIDSLIAEGKLNPDGSLA